LRSDEAGKWFDLLLVLHKEDQENGESRTALARMKYLGAFLTEARQATDK
jgi:hypothetical protein